MTGSSHADRSFRLVIALDDAGADDDDVEAGAMALQERLLADLDDVSVRRPATDSGLPGSKGGGGAEVGELFVTLAENPEIVTGFFGVVTGWLARDRRRSVKVVGPEGSVELSDATPQQQADALAWLRRGGRHEPES